LFKRLGPSVLKSVRRGQGLYSGTSPGEKEKKRWDDVLVESEGDKGAMFVKQPKKERGPAEVEGSEHYRWRGTLR